MSKGEWILLVIIFIYMLVMVYLFNCNPRYMFWIGLAFVIVSGATFILFLRKDWIW